MGFKENHPNWKSIDDRPPEEAFAIRSKGGKASVAARMQNKSFKDAMLWVLDLPAIMQANADVETLRAKFPNLTNRDAISISMAAEAIRKGNVKAFEAIRDTVGEVPVKPVEVKQPEPLTVTIRTLGEDEALPVEPVAEETLKEDK